MAEPALVSTNRGIRSAAFAFCVLPIGLYLAERDAGAAAWLAVARSVHPTRAELDNLYLDAALLGGWVGYLGFPVWISYALICAAMLNAAVNRGWRGAALSLACSAAGAGLWVALGGLRFTPQTSPGVTFLALVGSLGYVTAVGVVVWKQTRRLAGARHDLTKSEDRYRLIAENADDLVAMVDAHGRWLYASPSHGRVFPPAELALGADAFQRIHPDDAEQARAAIARAAASGKPRELALRLVDREGRARQYRSHVQPVAGSSAPHQLIMVSHDVTDLRQSEEKILLAAHALEGMTEAIMITAADGTIVTVNRAFCEITGLGRDEVLGQTEKAIRSGLQPAQFYDEAYAVVQREGYWSGTTWNRRKNGSVYREWRSIRAVKDAAGAVTHGAVTHYVHVFYEVGSPRATSNQAVS